MTKKKKRVALESPPRDVEWKKVEDLFLDSLNYRLPEEYRDATELELIEILARDYSLLEIGRSLADNGYFSEEPLVAIPADEEGAFTVVEGNRRLAALKLLLDDEKAEKFKLHEWVKLSKKLRYTLDKVPVLIYENREQVIPYLGFRHITGIMKWEAVAKARFINSLILEEEKNFQEVARIVGDEAPTIRQYFAAYRLLVQAKERFGLDVSRAEHDFGVLLRGVQSVGIRDFIGLQYVRKKEKDLRYPTTKKYAEHLKEVLLWMFGSKDRLPVLKDSRQITNLGRILKSKKATEALRDGNDFEYALQTLEGEEHRLLDHLRKASYQLRQALSDVHLHKEKEEVESFVQICWQTMREIVRHFPAVKENRDK